MEITIKAEPKEIAALVVAIQERPVVRNEVNLEVAKEYAKMDANKIRGISISIPDEAIHDSD